MLQNSLSHFGALHNGKSFLSRVDERQTKVFFGGVVVDRHSWVFPFPFVKQEVYKCLENKPFNNVLTVLLAVEEDATDENDFVATILRDIMLRLLELLDLSSTSNHGSFEIEQEIILVTLAVYILHLVCLFKQKKRCRQSCSVFFRFKKLPTWTHGVVA